VGGLGCNIGLGDGESFAAAARAAVGTAALEMPGWRRDARPWSWAAGSPGTGGVGAGPRAEPRAAAPGQAAAAAVPSIALSRARKEKKQGRIWQAPESPSSGMLRLLPLCLWSSPGRSDPPSLTPRGEMSAGFAGHPAAPSPPGCTVRPKADERRGAACSRATSEWLSSVTRDISPGVTRGGQRQAAEGQSSPKNTHLRASVFVAASLCDTHAGS